MKKTSLLLSIIAVMCFSCAQNTVKNPSPEIDNILKDFKGNISFQVWQYDSTLIKQKDSCYIANGKNADLKIGNSQFKVEIEQKPIENSDKMELKIKFRLEKGQMPQTGVAVKFNFSQWSKDNYVLVPAIVYNGNRFRAIDGGYCPQYPEDAFYNPKSELMFSDNPRLSQNNTASQMELQTGYCSTPAMTFFSPNLKKAFVLLTEQKTQFGNLGYVIDENAEKTNGSFTVTSPCVRKEICEFGGFRKSKDIAADWKTGDEVEMRFIITSFDCPNIPEFLLKFQDLRKLLTGESIQRNLTPMSAIYDFSAKTTDKNRWRESKYGNVYHSDFSNEFQLCWVSGMISSYSMINLNDNFHVKRGCETVDFVVRNMQGKSGYFYGYFDMKKGVPKTEYNRENLGEIVTLTRKNTDALFWFIKHFLLLKELGHEKMLKPEWEIAVKRLAQAMVKTWKKYGEFGQYINPKTGEIAIYNSTSAAMAGAGLALASKYFNEPEFLTVAKDATNYYYQRDVVKLGLTGGHSGDTSQDADADSAYGLLESIMALYYATGDKAWLEKAKVVEALCETWTLSYNYQFPRESDLGKLDVYAAGAVWASVQNKHAAPGICTSSGDYLFKLYRETGNERYAKLLKEIQHTHTETVETPGRPTVSTGSVDWSYIWGKVSNDYGSSVERIALSDCEKPKRIGMLPNVSYGWNETNGMLMAMEIPGIYIQTDLNKMYVFDHVEVSTNKLNDNTTKLTIKNPTKFDASVSVFAETSENAKKYLGYMDFLKWEKINVKSGKSTNVDIDNNGKIISITQNN